MACCKLEPTEFETKLALFWSKVKPSMDTLFQATYVAELFGKPCKKYNLMMDFNYLAVLLTLMYRQIQLDRSLTDCSEWLPISDYYTTYKIDCIIAKFWCSGINIKPLISIFVPLPETDGGIGSMEIEGNGNCSHLPFIVK